jgi:hypothetical protein
MRRTEAGETEKSDYNRESVNLQPRMLHAWLEEALQWRRY